MNPWHSHDADMWLHIRRITARLGLTTLPHQDQDAWIRRMEESRRLDSERYGPVRIDVAPGEVRELLAWADQRINAHQAVVPARHLDRLPRRAGRLQPIRIEGP